MKQLSRIVFPPSSQCCLPCCLFALLLTKTTTPQIFCLCATLLLLLLFFLLLLQKTSPFAAISNSHAIVNIFSEDDFKIAFNKVAASSSNKTISLAQVTDVLEIVYHGPAPKPELVLFTDKFGNDRTEPIAWEEFCSAYHEICKKIVDYEDSLGGQLGSAATYTSYDELCKAKQKGFRLEHGPKETLVAPLTAVQEFGWSAHEHIEKISIHGKKSCPETIYASELVKSGVFY